MTIEPAVIQLGIEILYTHDLSMCIFLGCKRNADYVPRLPYGHTNVFQTQTYQMLNISEIKQLLAVLIEIYSRSMHVCLSKNLSLLAIS